MTLTRPLIALPPQKTMGWFCFACLLSISLGGSVEAQSSGSRNLGRTASPPQLFQKLQRFGAKAEGMDTTAIMDLIERSHDILSSLSPEQRQQAKEFAEGFIRKNGLDSPESKMLMSQLGVDANTQKKLRELFRQGEFNHLFPDGSELAPESDQMFQELEQSQLERNIRRMKSRAAPSPSAQPSPQSDQAPVDPIRAEANSRQRDRQILKQLQDQKIASGLGAGMDQELLELAIKDLASDDSIIRQFNPGAVSKSKQDEPPDEDSAFGSLLEQGKSLLSNTQPNRSSGEKLEARFDRFLLDAAKNTLRDRQSKTNSDDDSLIPGAFESMMDDAIKQVGDSFKSERQRRKDQQARAERRQQERRASQSSNRSEPPPRSPTNPSAPSAPTDTPSPDPPPPTDNGDGSLQNWEAGMDFWVSFALLAVAAGAGLIFWLGWRAQDQEEPTRKHQLALKHRLRKRSFRNSRDLVDAIDLYLLAHHGPNADWWNAQYAEQQVHRRQPDMQERIARLFRFYSQSRYTETQPPSAADDPREIEATLRELVSHQAKSTDDSNQSPLSPAVEAVH